MRQWPNQPIRIVVLIAMLIAISAPWIYDRVNVPAEYACTNGVRLEGDFCGIPIPGLQVFGLYFLSIFGALARIPSGDLAWRELFGSVLIMAFFLPVMSSFLILVRKTDLERVQRFHLGSLGLGLAIGIWILVSFSSVLSLISWGLIVYLAILVAALGLEGVGRYLRIKAS